ncbi:NAC domain-containing protein 83 [Ziziphus jujuba]|uniref:NAC domain-containing protein 83 n=1 Tax=Ziziphus jujuba TaxID=326968 RepID=A0A6P4A2J5_ZIZJJ|nr:NAC domain-containing protein 83 [Ziziphus jujuba]
MEKFNFLRDGVIRLPPGFRFQPTDEEIIFQYLRRKVFCCPLPACIIPEINVCKYDPWDLPGDLGQERYFFSNKEAKYRNGKRTNRTTNSGYWKATGSDKRFVSSRMNHIVGLKKTLVFHRGKPPHGSRTEWVMHEYSLIDAAGSKTCTKTMEMHAQNSLNQTENWVLCRIFMRKRNAKDGEEITHENNFKDYNKAGQVGVEQPRLLISNFVMGCKNNGHLGPDQISCSSSSSSSSSITEISEVSSSEADCHEESSTNF